MTLALGVNTCFAVKRWPRPQDWAPIVRDELGLDVVQHSLDLVDLDADLEEQAAAVRSACASAGLALHSTFTGLAAYSSPLLLGPDEGGRRRAEAFYERLIRFSALAGAGRAGGHVGSLSRPDYDDPARRAERRQSLHAALERLRRSARAAGLDALLVENMACEREPARMDELRDLLADPDAEHAGLELCLDVGHQCVPGTSGDERDPYAWLRALGARASVVHLQQSDAEGDHHWPFTPAYNARGRIDGPRVLDALRPAQPCLILEVIPSFEAPDDQVLADLRASVEYWRQALA